MELRGASSGRIRDGTTIQNKEGILPSKPAGYYTEYVHPTSGASGAGAQRVVVGKGGDLWYSPDHYKSFTKVR